MPYESPVTFKMIIKPHLQYNTHFKILLEEAVTCIKTWWIQLSKSLIQGNLKIEEKNKMKNAIKLINLIEKKLE